MPNKLHKTLMITIADNNGQKQFTITKFTKKLITYGSIVFFIIIISGYFILSYIIHKLDSINLQKQDALSQYMQVHKQNELLRDDISSKVDELRIVNEKISDLESVVTIKNSANMTDLKQSLNLDSITSFQKATMLQIIPNGNPIQSFEEIKKTTHIATRKEASTLNTIGFYNVGNASNKGYDYYTKIKTPVRASADGLVEFTRKNYQKGYGNIVRLVHVLGFSSSYTHLSSINVKVGQFVTKGQIIGYTTPSSSKAISLYYEVRFLSQGVDTGSFIRWGEDNFNAIFISEQNSMIDFSSLIWTLKDIAKLREISTSYSKQKE